MPSSDQLVVLLKAESNSYIAKQNSDHWVAFIKHEQNTYLSKFIGKTNLCTTGFANNFTNIKQAEGICGNDLQKQSCIN